MLVLNFVILIFSEQEKLVCSPSAHTMPTLAPPKLLRSEFEGLHATERYLICTQDVDAYKCILVHSVHAFTVPQSQHADHGTFVQGGRQEKHPHQLQTRRKDGAVVGMTTHRRTRARMDDEGEASESSNVQLGDDVVGEGDEDGDFGGGEDGLAEVAEAEVEKEITEVWVQQRLTASAIASIAGVSGGAVLLGLIVMVATRPSTTKPLVFDVNYDARFVIADGAISSSGDKTVSAGFVF